MLPIGTFYANWSSCQESRGLLYSKILKSSPHDFAFETCCTLPVCRCGSCLLDPLFRSPRPFFVAKCLLPVVGPSRFLYRWLQTNVLEVHVRRALSGHNIAEQRACPSQHEIAAQNSASLSKVVPRELSANARDFTARFRLPPHPAPCLFQVFHLDA